MPPFKTSGSPARRSSVASYLSCKPAVRARGFALLITIVLVAFLVLILVGLATFTRVETQVASNAQDLSKARQNALFALNIAVGELQRTTGPDQRTTARAELENAASASPGWTAAYGYGANPNVAPGSGNPAAPRRLNWLVSGNENTTFTVSATAGAANYGTITANAAPAFLPTDLVGGLAADPDPLTGAGFTVGGQPAALLVGGATADCTTLAQAQANAVVAPLRTIQASGVPGLAAGPQPVGRYAWWVGDEGVKARLNLSDPFKPAAGADTYDAQQLAAQRIDVTKIQGLETFPVTPAALTALDRVLMLNQVPMLPDAPASFDANVRTRFHQVTPYSAGVLADTRRGGLKRDLSFLFNQSTVADFRTALNNTYPTATPAAPAAANYGSPIISTATSPWAASLTAPSLSHSSTWEQLWSFGRLATDGVVTATTATVRPMTAVQYGITPMLVHYRNSFGIKHTIVATVDTREYHMRMLAALANPYALDLNTPQHPESGFGSVLAHDPGENRYYLMLAADSGGGADVSEFLREVEPAVGPVTKTKIFDIDRLSARVQINPFHARVVVRDTDGALPAGRSRIYTLENDLSRADDMTRLDDPLRYIMTPGVRDNRSIFLRDETISEWGSKVGLAFAPSAAASAPVSRLRLFLLNRSGVYPGSPDVRDPNQTGLISVSYGFNVTATPAGKGFITRQLPAASPVSADTAILWEDSSESSGGDAGYLAYRMSFADAPSVTSPFSAWVDFNTRAAAPAPSSTFPSQPIVECGFVPTNSGEDWLNGLNYSTTTNQLRWGGSDQFENILFDLPRVGTGVYSLGFLQHFNVGGHFADRDASSLGYTPSGNTSKTTEAGMASALDKFAPHAYSPAYAIGNSHAAPLIPRTAVKSATLNFIDHSYLFNDILWDGFTTTTQAYPAAGALDFSTTTRAVNKRYVPFRSGAAATETTGTTLNARSAAKQLLVKGAFNVNSTSVEAWTALLCSLAGVRHNGATASGLEAGFPRTLAQPGAQKKSPVIGDSEYWNGVRELDATSAGNELRKLAQRIVVEVRARGPFLSLSDFVNRRLTNDTTGLRGTLQAAIDDVQGDGGLGADSLNPVSAGRAPSTGLADADHRAADLQAGPPGWVLQGDVLQALGPVISSRSDTFTVRTYGEVLDPVNSTAAVPVVLARAWCEAVVQRMPDYLDATADEATKRPDELTSATNLTHGRRYQVVSFRWLQPEDL